MKLVLEPFLQSMDENHAVCMHYSSTMYSLFSASLREHTTWEQLISVHAKELHKIEVTTVQCAAGLWGNLEFLQIPMQHHGSNFPESRGLMQVPALPAYSSDCILPERVDAYACSIEQATLAVNVRSRRRRQNTWQPCTYGTDISTFHLDLWEGSASTAQWLILMEQAEPCDEAASIEIMTLATASSDCHHAA